MISPYLRMHGPAWRAVALVMTLPLLLLAIQPCALAADSPGQDAVLCQPASNSLVFANWVSQQMGNRTRMIQVGCVCVAIGVFLLSRSYR